jgi:prepilin peptidase CpaA
MSLLVAYTFPFAMSMAGFLDLLTMKIPNKLVLFFLAIFCIAAPLSGIAWPELTMHLAAGGLCLLVAFALFIPGWIGGGDAKFFAVAALWVGWDQLLEFTAITSIIGGAMALGLVLYRAYPMPVPLMRVDWLTKLHEAETGIPYGIAIAFAGMIVFGDTRWADLAGM